MSPTSTVQRGKLIAAISAKLGNYTVRKAGTEFVFSCPYCKHKKLEINIDKGFYHCFRCHKGGRVKTLLTKLLVGYNLVSTDYRPERGVFLAQEVTAPNYYSCLLTRHLVYLRERGISTQRATDMEYGYSNNKKLYMRLIIPIIEQGLKVCYVARAIDGAMPKEICPPSNICNRSHFLYNLDGIDNNDRVVLVEGIFGCEALVKRGLKAVASMGSNLSEIQVGKLLSKHPKAINIMYDGDAAGRKGAVRAYEKFITRISANIYIVPMDEGKQPDTLTEEDWNKIRLI